MQEAEEQDTCRICSAPAEPDQPLFYPCKCSGTIRYIHQECLTTWLSHSKKKTCDVCKHPYAFTKVYAADMPPRLPPVLLARRLVQQAIFALLISVRAVLVGMVWLAMLPWATVWTWRICFTIGELTAWYISDRTPTSQSDDVINPFYYNLPNDNPRPPSLSLSGEISNHPVWIALSSDIFTGQIIASLIVVTFVAIFLLREWISQNARPGVFEGEEIPLVEVAPVDAADPAPPPQDPDDHPIFPPMDVQDRLALAERQMEAVRAFDRMQAMRRASQGRGKAPDRTRRNSSAGETTDQSIALREAKRQKMFEGEELGRSDYRKQQKAFSRRLYVARVSNAVRRDEEDRRHSPSSELDLPYDLPPVPESWPGPSSGPSEWPSEFTFTPPNAPKLPSKSPSSSPSPFPSVVMQPPSGSLPFSFNQPSKLPASTSSAPATPFRRPPLPNTFLPPSDSGPSSPVRVTPLLSPSLATYRAPEDLEAEAGPSTSTAGYFDATPRDAPSEAEASAHNSNSSSDFDLSDDAMNHYFEEEGHTAADLLETQGSMDEIEEEDEIGEDEGGMEDEEEEEDIGIDEGDVVVLGLHGIERPAGQDENAPPANVPGLAEDAAMAANINDELDVAGDDDMEGALEAIGMRGPLHTIVQNAMLMMFVLDTAIILCILIPFTIGKSTLLISLDPSRFLQLLHLPIRAIRVLTDPIVDTVVFVITKVVAPQYFNLLHGFTQLLLSTVLLVLRKIVGDNVVDQVESGVTRLVNQITEALPSWSFESASPSNVTDTMTEPTFLNEKMDELLTYLEPTFAPVGKELRISVREFMDWWMGLALGHGSKERAAAIIVGYAVVAFLLISYVNILSMGNKEAGKSVKNFFRQHLLVFKVAGFIIIELVLFPHGCGIVLDLCALWFFVPENFESRRIFLYQAPLTATFYHWVAGTMFMYSFAILLSGCRSIMRPGAMWFVKDPQDQNSHPIRDILDRSSITQLRKICISAVMYTFIVAFTTASAATLLSVGSRSILPFRWKSREPLSKVPVDLLFLQIVLPYTIHYFRPRKTVKKIVTATWKYLARQLRLTSYFFGSRYPIEEVSAHRWDVTRLWTRKYLLDPLDKQDGSFRRVPALDGIALPKNMSATAAVTDRGAPIDAESAYLIARQNIEAKKAKRDIKADYMIVYIPPHFRYRLVVFILSLWSLGAMSAGFILALPIAIGRGFFKLIITEDVHDGYSFLAGFYLLWGCYIIGRAVERLDKRRQRRGDDGPRAHLATLIFKRGLLWTAQTTYMVFFLGVVVPTLVAIVVDLYVVLPIRLAMDPTMEPTIRIVDEWALGLLYVKIGLHAHRVQPQGSVARGIEHIRHNGWTHPDPVRATKTVIVPVVAGLSAMILLPSLLFVGLQYLLPFIHVNDKFLFIQVYPAIFVLAALFHSAFASADLLASWSQSVRDKEFLVEMRLKNHESPPPPPPLSVPSALLRTAQDRMQLDPVDMLLDDEEEEYEEVRLED